MVLYFDDGKRTAAVFPAHSLRHFLRNDKGIVPRMQVTGDHIRPDFQKGCIALDRLLQRPHASDVRQIPDIGRGIKEPPCPDTKCVLELSSNGQHAGAGDLLCSFIPLGEHVGKRRISAGPSDHVGRSLKEIHDGVVRPDPYLSVVGQNAVADISQLLHRLCVVPADRCARYVAAGHDQTVRHGDAVRVVKEKHLHRGIGQHDADSGIAGRDPPAELSALFL